MNALITGGAGFIGSHLADRLVESGVHVAAFDNLSFGRQKNVEHLSANPNFEFVEMDILDSAFHSAFQSAEPDMVFHLAANSDIRQSHEAPDIDLNNTFLTTYRVLEAMRISGCRKLFFASTSAVYGEIIGAAAEDSGPLRPISHYGAGKLSSEAFIASFAANYDFQIWIARFPNVVGDRATHGVIFDFINRLKTNPAELRVLGNGGQTKPYLYVKDLIDALLFIWKNARDRFNCFNVGVDSVSSVSEIAEMTVEEMGLKGTTVIRYGETDRGWVGDVPVFRYCLEKINALGWRAPRPSNEAVRKAIRAILRERT